MDISYFLNAGWKQHRLFIYLLNSGLLRKAHAITGLDKVSKASLACGIFRGL